jgi:hypothetical protein
VSTKGNGARIKNAWCIARLTPENLQFCW